MNNNKQKPQLNIPVVSGSYDYDNDPEDCLKKYDEQICKNCSFNSFDMVGHPGGGCDGRVSVEKHYCELCYWKEDF
jgi:uncharacterized alpha/beta hydrolase family protein